MSGWRKEKGTPGHSGEAQTSQSTTHPAHSEVTAWLFSAKFTLYCLLLSGKVFLSETGVTADFILSGQGRILQDCSLVTQSCLTLCDPMDCSLPGSSVHGILQATVLRWVTISFSRESSWPRDWTQVSHTADRFFIVWATRVATPESIWLVDVWQKSTQYCKALSFN